MVTHEFDGKIIFEMETPPELKIKYPLADIAKKFVVVEREEAHCGKIGGYYDPIDAWIAIDPSAQIVQVEVSGIQQFSQTRFSFTNYPLLRIGDIIVEMKTDQRWRITRVFFPQRNGVLFLQSGELEQINRSDIEYKSITIPLDRKKELISKLNDRIKRDSL